MRRARLAKNGFKYGGKGAKLAGQGVKLGCGIVTKVIKILGFVLVLLHYNDLRINNHTLAALRRAEEMAAAQGSDCAKESGWDCKMKDDLPIEKENKV